MSISSNLTSLFFINSEIQELILRKLDPKSLMNWAIVGDKRLNVSQIYRIQLEDSHSQISRVTNATKYERVGYWMQKQTTYIRKFALTFIDSTIDELTHRSGIKLDSSPLSNSYQFFMQVLNSCNNLQRLELIGHPLLNQDYLNSLPQSLTYLELKGCQELRKLLLPSQLIGLCVDHEIAQLPPHLTSLKFSEEVSVEPEEMKKWPQTLLSLSIRIGNDFTLEHWEALPRSLTQLSVKFSEMESITEEELRFLPPDLLDFSTDSSLSLRNLINSLKNPINSLENPIFKVFPQNLIRLNCCTWTIGDDELSFLPSTLTDLTLNITHLTQEGLKKIPQSLRQLRVQSQNLESIEFLPSCLKAFHAYGHTTLSNLHMLPVGLEVLSLKLANTKVDLSKVDLIHLTKLLSLELENVVGDFNTWQIPESLTSFSLHFTANNFVTENGFAFPNIARLPRALTHLSIKGLPDFKPEDKRLSSSLATTLPPSLETLPSLDRYSYLALKKQIKSIENYQALKKQIKPVEKLKEEREIQSSALKAFYDDTDDLDF